MVFRLDPTPNLCANFVKRRLRLSRSTVQKHKPTFPGGWQIMSDTKQTCSDTAQLGDRRHACCAQRRCRCSHGLFHRQENLWEGNRPGSHAAPADVEFHFRAADCHRNCTRGRGRSACLLRGTCRGRKDGTSTLSGPFLLLELRGTI